MEQVLDDDWEQLKFRVGRGYRPLLEAFEAVNVICQQGQVISPDPALIDALWDADARLQEFVIPHRRVPSEGEALRQSLFVLAGALIQAGVQGSLHFKDRMDELGPWTGLQDWPRYKERLPSLEHDAQEFEKVGILLFAVVEMANLEDLGFTSQWPNPSPLSQVISLKDGLVQSGAAPWLWGNPPGFINPDGSVSGGHAYVSGPGYHFSVDLVTGEIRNEEDVPRDESMDSLEEFQENVEDRW